MAIAIEVNADGAEKLRRLALARRVLDAFGSLPSARLLCFLDQVDHAGFKSSPVERGRFWPMEQALLNQAPAYLRPLLVTGNASGHQPKVEHLIYVHGSTCQNDIGLTMTFAHELQHFVQHTTAWRLWAAGAVLQQFVTRKNQEGKLNWGSDRIPHEREARIVAKQHATSIFGPVDMHTFIANQIQATPEWWDREDWEFIQTINTREPFDLEEETRKAFQDEEIKPYRAELEKLLRRMQRTSPHFRGLDLADVLT